LIVLWSYSWRALLITILASFVIAIPVHRLKIALGLKEYSPIISLVLGIVSGIFGSGYAFKKILNKKYKNFSVALIK
jgi:high-affinity Fe2+/Pb2+ permease